ncbi:hypothetical protein TNCV_1175481 [Trichonephila clavipes]|nr:hypothetical protein TNCV_1175481 [Trichonephila clavipes]
MNPGKGMVVCKFIVSARHEGTLNRRRAASPLVKLVEEEEMLEASDHRRVLSLKIEVEPRKIILSPAWCSKLRLATCVKI